MVPARESTYAALFSGQRQHPSMPSLSSNVKTLPNVLQVRKKADPAKNLVKGWLSDWKDAPGVQGEASYTQLSGVPPLPLMKGQ